MCRKSKTKPQISNFKNPFLNFTEHFNDHDQNELNKPIIGFILFVHQLILNKN